jgi:hypothetical protein
LALYFKSLNAIASDIDENDPVKILKHPNSRAFQRTETTRLARLSIIFFIEILWIVTPKLFGISVTV